MYTLICGRLHRSCTTVGGITGLPRYMRIQLINDACEKLDAGCLYSLTNDSLDKYLFACTSLRPNALLSDFNCSGAKYTKLREIVKSCRAKHVGRLGEDVPQPEALDDHVARAGFDDDWLKGPQKQSKAKGKPKAKSKRARGSAPTDSDPSDEPAPKHKAKKAASEPVPSSSSSSSSSDAKAEAKTVAVITTPAEKASAMGYHLVAPGDADHQNAPRLVRADGSFAFCGKPGEFVDFTENDGILFLSFPDRLVTVSLEQVLKTIRWRTQLALPPPAHAARLADAPVAADAAALAAAPGAAALAVAPRAAAALDAPGAAAFAAPRQSPQPHGTFSKAASMVQTMLPARVRMPWAAFGSSPLAAVPGTPGPRKNSAPTTPPSHMMPVPVAPGPLQDSAPVTPPLQSGSLGPTSSAPAAPPVVVEQLLKCPLCHDDMHVHEYLTAFLCGHVAHNECIVSCAAAKFLNPHDVPCPFKCVVLQVVSDDVPDVSTSTSSSSSSPAAAAPGGGHDDALAAIEEGLAAIFAGVV